MAKAIQRDEAKRNRAAFLKSVVRGDTSLLVRASFLCGDYKAKAVQPTNAKHLEVEHGRGVRRKPKPQVKGVILQQRGKIAPLFSLNGLAVCMEMVCLTFTN